jgi:hypothetical protein
VKCQMCKEEQAVWAWQPLGPSETPDNYGLIGSHARGFPVIKVCSSCKSAFQTGDFPIHFEYKGFRYIGQHHEVRQVKPSFWDGGTTSLNLSGSATMIMQDTPGGSELVALVTNPSFVTSFVAVPDLIEVCEQIVQAFPDDDTLIRSQSLAVARARVALKALSEV